MNYILSLSLFFFFNDTATTEIYTLSLHDALRSRRSLTLSCIGEDSLLQPPVGVRAVSQSRCGRPTSQSGYASSDRKSTRLNSSHDQISYAVFCLKKNNIIATCKHSIYITQTSSI